MLIYNTIPHLIHDIALILSKNVVVTSVYFLYIKCTILYIFQGLVKIVLKARLFFLTKNCIFSLRASEIESHPSVRTLLTIFVVPRSGEIFKFILSVVSLKMIRVS